MLSCLIACCPHLLRMSMYMAYSIWNIWVIRKRWR